MTESTEKVICINSFPRSGNTWLREIIGRLFDASPMGDYIPDIYQEKQLGKSVRVNGDDCFFFKSHAKNLSLSEREVGRSIDITIHIRRHPLDVFCSQLNFVSRRVAGCSVHDMVMPLESVETAAGNATLSHFYSAFLVFGTLLPAFPDFGNWVSSGEYWTGMARECDSVVCLTYEDLLRCPVEALAGLRERFDLTDSQITSAVARAEAATARDGLFFWRKTKGTFREYLSVEQIKQFSDLYGEIAASLGYEI